MPEEKYAVTYAAAAVRGHLARAGQNALADTPLFTKPLQDLTEEEKQEIIQIGESLGLKLYHFKKSDRHLPRVNKVLGFLKGIYFESLLDVGSGRGVFLIPFLEEFPHIATTSIDILDKRIALLSDLAAGGITNLRVDKANICAQPYSDRSVDMVTLLEVLEHIPAVQDAIRSAVNMARKFVVVTVPSKEDNNPEHIHLLTKEKLTAYFAACGVSKLRFDGVPGHLMLIANVEESNRGA